MTRRYCRRLVVLQSLAIWLAGRPQLWLFLCVPTSGAFHFANKMGAASTAAPRPWRWPMDAAAAASRIRKSSHPRSFANRQRSFQSTLHGTSDLNHSKPAVSTATPPWSHYKPTCPLILPGTFGATAEEPIRTVMAPMVAQSDYAFRATCRHYGTDLTFTQMIHAMNYCRDTTFRLQHVDVWEKHQPQQPLPTLGEAQLNYLGNRDRLLEPPNASAASGPVIAQLAGHNVDVVTRAALHMLDHHTTSTGGSAIAGFDLNLGCPQGIARKGRYGAFLMEEDETIVCSILSSLRKALPDSVSVSAKIRLSLDPAQQHERIQRLVDTGIDFLTVHGRDLKENKTLVAGVHADRLASAVASAGPDIPVIANGGIEEASDILPLLEQTGASAVMSSEALLERPNLFDSRRPVQQTPQERFEQQMEMAETYVKWTHFAPPLPGVLGVVGGSCNVVRAHLFKILHTYLTDDPEFRHQLADFKRFHRLEQAEDFLEQLRARYSTNTEEDWERLQYPETSWYRRHRKGQNKVRSKFQRVAVDTSSWTMEERKQAMRDRIAKLQNKKKSNMV